ncbi:unnamed protein product [Aspergillus oryzae]|nr:unnamed protein product [Aspergillus oryzae]
MEPIRERVRHALTHRVDGPDNTDQYNEPVSSIDQSNRVLIEIDPLNEEYGTQWIGHDPNMEELLEVPETPENPQDEDENAHRRVMALIDTLQEVVSPRRRTPVSRLYRTQQIEVEPPRRQETLTNWTNNVINEIMRNPMRFSRPLRMLLEQCLHWNHECWDSNIENWDEHCQQCDKHPIVCEICGADRFEYYGELELINLDRAKRGHEGTHHWLKECECCHYATEPMHNRYPWVVCFDDSCTHHRIWKQIARFWPQNGANRGTLAATRQGRHITTIIAINGRPARAMIDSGATNNFMSPRY